MRLFDVGEVTEQGWRLHKRLGKEKDHLFLPVGSPGSSRYLCLRVGKSLWEDPPEVLENAYLMRDRYGVFCLTRQKQEDDVALVRACVASTLEVPIRYEFSEGAMVVIGGVFGTDPPVPMYLLEMRRGSSFRWQRGHDGVVYTWDGKDLHEKRGIELPS